MWDRTYKAGETGSSLCPGGDKADIVVVDGNFSIPWTILAADQPVTIAHIIGHVRPSGMTENVRVQFVSPMPRKALQQFELEQTSFNDIRTRDVKVAFAGGGKVERRFSVTSEQVSCGLEWTEDRDAITATAAAAVDCSSGPYAAPMWTKTRAYRSGEFARIETPGQPTSLYRCIDACKPGADPKTAREDNAAVWSLYGECEGKGAAATALPSTGAAKWDMTYVRQSGFSQDWRCVRNVEKLVVSKGRFTIPWKVSAGDDDKDVFEVGHIDGVIAADGAVTLQSVITATSLPPEVRTDGRKLGGSAAMASLRAVAPSMKFIFDVGKMNPSGQGRRAEFQFDEPNACELSLQATDYKPQQFKESDGWRVDCNSDQAWQSKHEYISGDHATVTTGGVTHQYRCATSTCAIGGRPGSRSEWELSGRCR